MPGGIPTRREILDILEVMETALGDIRHRWEAELPPEFRDQIADIHQAALLLLIRAKRRGQPPRR